MLARAAQPGPSPPCRSYLALLPVGFTLPPPLPAARCALTAPFHPCRPPPRRVDGLGGVFLWHFPWGRPRRALPGTVPPVEPGLSSLRRANRRRAAIRPSGRENLGRRALTVKRWLSNGATTARVRYPRNRQRNPV